MTATSSITLAVIVVLVAWFIAIYNRFVRLRNESKNAFAQIDVQLRRRHDLIPNLVAVAQGYMAHEKETLEAVTKARGAAVDAASAARRDQGEQAMAALSQADGALAAGLGRLMVLTEAYPELKANEEMRRLSEELGSTENRIGFARQAYNDAVLEFNNAREVFPNKLVGALLGIPVLGMLKSIEHEEQRQAPKVSF